MMPVPTIDDPLLKVLPSIEETSSLHEPPRSRPSDDTAKPVAVLVCHGMGQQVPFETLSSVANILWQPGPVPGATAPPEVRHVHFINKADPRRSRWLPRAELTATSADGTQTRRVHVYEVYWAPLTQGRIALTEVMKFLFSAGRRGLFQQGKFKRWVFGSTQTYDCPISTPLALLGTLVIISALVIINLVLALVLGSNALTPQYGPAGTAVTHAMVFYLTVDLGWLLAAAGVAVVFVLGSRWRHSRAVAARPPRRITSSVADWLAWGALGLLVLVILFVAVVMAMQYLQLRQANGECLTKATQNCCATVDTVRQTNGGCLTPWLRLPLPSCLGGKTSVTDGISWWLLVPVWGLVLGFSFVARRFFVEYLGDVAIYIDSYKVDKFYKIREQIRRTAFETACTIYGARTAQTDVDGRAAFAYDKVVLVGHSLGSVVAYDTLNATLNLDESMGTTLCVARRTGSLLTFGSPLDKIAFIFNSQHPNALLRVGLAASMQPLITSPLNRSSIHWVNIYSGNDIISGELNFYELPKAVRTGNNDPQDVRVKNLADPQAVTPLLAHTQFWSNPLLAEQLQEAVFRADALRPTGP